MNNVVDRSCYIQLLLFLLAIHIIIYYLVMLIIMRGCWCIGRKKKWEKEEKIWEKPHFYTGCPPPPPPPLKNPSYAPVKPGPFDPELSALTMGPPRLPRKTTITDLFLQFGEAFWTEGAFNHRPETRGLHVSNDILAKDFFIAPRVNTTYRLITAFISVFLIMEQTNNNSNACSCFWLKNHASYTLTKSQFS